MTSTSTPWESVSCYSSENIFIKKDGEYIEATDEDKELMCKAVNCHDDLVSALDNMMRLHEPEGRFQPSYFKPFLLESVRALSKAWGISEDDTIDLLNKKAMGEA